MHQRSNGFTWETNRYGSPCWLPSIIAGIIWASGSAAADGELPVHKIPKISETAEIYYAPDSYHLIGQLKGGEGLNGNEPTTHIFTDDGKEAWPINDRGDDACSFFFPDQKRVVWTSTRDNLDLPPGDWSDEPNYPTGADLYISDLDGGNLQRLTNNHYYDAEVAVSPNGEWVLFGRQINGKMDLWRIRPDGSDEQQITFTEEWQEGGAFYLPDSETILYRAWKRSDWTNRRPTAMAIFTIKHDGTEMRQRTAYEGINWAPFPAPNGRHYAYVRVIEDDNWEIFLGDLEGGEPIRLTYNDTFDGFPAFSPDGQKMVFARSQGSGFASGFYSYVMDVSSLNLAAEAP